jgi:hypothetical protein
MDAEPVQRRAAVRRWVINPLYHHELSPSPVPRHFLHLAVLFPTQIIQVTRPLGPRRGKEMRSNFVSAFVLVAALVLTCVSTVEAMDIGQPCGDVVGIKCDAGLFCQFKHGTCGKLGPGTCVKTPEVCSTVVNPVCGCNGKTYPNDCAREQAAVSNAHNGSCS